MAGRPTANRLTPYTELAEVLALLPGLVREKRRRCGLSLRDAAGQAGVPFTSLTRFEHGANISLTSAIALLAWVGAS